MVARRPRSAGHGAVLPAPEPGHLAVAKQSADVQPLGLCMLQCSLQSKHAVARPTARGNPYFANQANIHDLEHPFMHSRENARCGEVDARIARGQRCERNGLPAPLFIPAWSGPRQMRGGVPGVNKKWRESERYGIGLADAQSVESSGQSLVFAVVDRRISAGSRERIATVGPTGMKEPARAMLLQPAVGRGCNTRLGRDQSACVSAATDARNAQGM